MLYPNAYLYSLEKSCPAVGVQRLFQQAGWADNRSVEQVEQMLEGTTATVGVWDGETLIGFARVLSDDIYRAFIEDVVVDAAYRKQGVGTEMVRHLVARYGHVEEMFLACDERLMPFYGQFGFQRSNYGHMIRRLD